MRRRKFPKHRRNKKEKLNEILGTPGNPIEDFKEPENDDYIGKTDSYPADFEDNPRSYSTMAGNALINNPPYHPPRHIRRVNLNDIKREINAEIENDRVKKEENRFRFDRTPRQLYGDLTKYVIGQGEALQKICNAVCYHYQRISGNNKTDKCNVLFIGPTGCGKTYVVEKISEAMEVPLLISDATRFSGTGYVGESVDSLVQDLVTKANGDLNKASRGIIYLDEIDKIAAKDGSGRDVSGRDVQNGLLKIVEKGDVKVLSNQGPSIINTKDILFVGGGAFTGISNTLRGYSVSESSIKEELNDEELLYESSPPELIKGLKKFGIIPELLGRMPVIAKFRQLEKEDLVRILKESEDTPIKKYEEDFKAYGIKASFSQDCYETIAGIAYERGMGARGLKSVIEESLTPFKFHLPGTGIKNFSVSSQTVLHPEEALLSLINDSKNKPIKNESQNKCKEVKKWQKHNQAPKNKNNT